MNLSFLFLVPLLVAVLHLLKLSCFHRKLLNLANFIFLMLCLFELKGTEGSLLLVGNWPHNAGIAWMLDSSNFVFLLGTLIVYLPVSLLISNENNKLQSLFHFLLASAIGSFLTADLFNLFVMFEILLTTTYAILFHPKDLKSGSSFIWINVIASSLFLFAIIYTYFSFGSVNMGDIASRSQEIGERQQDFIFWSLSAIFLIKGGLIPFVFWLPRTYPSIDSRVLAFIAAVLTKVGVYAFLKFGGLIFPESLERNRQLLMALALATILFGFLLAYNQRQLKPNFAYFGLSHIGFLFLVIIGSQSSLSRGFHLYLLQDMILIGLMFLFLAKNENRFPEKCSKLQLLIFFILIFSAAGFPPFPGFWAKLQILYSFADEPLFFFAVLGSSFLFVIWAMKTWTLLEVSKEPSSWRQDLGTSVCYGMLVFLSLLILPATGGKALQSSDDSAFDQDHFLIRLFEKSNQTKEKARTEEDQ